MTFLQEFNNKSDALMTKLRQLADNDEEVYILDEANNMTMDVIASVVKKKNNMNNFNILNQVGFSMESDSINQDTNLKGYVFKSLEGFNKILLDPFLKVSLISLIKIILLFFFQFIVFNIRMVLYKKLSSPPQKSKRFGKISNFETNRIYQRWFLCI